jgi:RNA polymerase sigma factor (sigma-70 family)
MKYTYRFVTGESFGLEVSAELEALLKNEDRLEYNNEQANTRRHISLEMAQEDEGMQFADPDSLPATDSAARLQAAVAMLPEAQRALLRAAFYDGMPIRNIAEREGVSQPAITQRLKTIKKKLKEILSDPYI